MLRTGKTPAIRREAPPIAEDASNSRETGQLSLHCVTRNRPDSLVNPNWSETPSLDFAACWSRLTGWTTISRPSFRSVPPAGTRIHWRDDAGNEARRPDTIDAGSAAGLAWRNAAGTAHNTHCP